MGAKALETGIEKQIEQSLQIVGVSVDEPTRICMKAITPEIREARCARAAHHFRGDTVDRWIAGEDRLPGVFFVGNSV